MPRSIYNYRNRPPTGPESAGSDPKLYIRQPIGYSDFPKEVSRKEFAHFFLQGIHTIGAYVSTFFIDCTISSILDQTDSQCQMVS